MRRSYVINRIERSTKETFASTVLVPEVDEYVKSRGPVLYPKLKSKILNKAKALGIEVPAKFGTKPWTGPALWVKGAAAEAIKSAMAANDLAALEAAIAATDNLEGVQFVKKKLDAKGKPIKMDPTACSKLLDEAKAAVAALKAAAPKAA